MDSSKLNVLTVKSYDELTKILGSLKGDESMTVVHYSTAWTEEQTGTKRSEGQLATMLENYENIKNYIKVTDARTIVRMGISIVPTFEIYYGDERRDECHGADLILFREVLEMNDPRRTKEPFTKGEVQGSFPRPEGSYVPIFSTFNTPAN